MQKKFKKPGDKLFRPQDRYYNNNEGWWFYTVEMISGPYATKPQCVDACRRYIQHRDNSWHAA